MREPLPVPVPLADIEAARRRVAGTAVRTPLLRLHIDAPCTLWLKLENLQPIGSFKIRGAANAMALADPDALARGVWTASAGNMAQGVAWCARERGIPCTVVVPDHAPAAKVQAVERLGARVVRTPHEDWWRILVDHGAPGYDGVFIHPVSERAVIAGNGTVGLEIVDDLPAVDAVVVPYGGGGLACGIASAMAAVAPHVPVFAAEVDTAAPLAAALRAGEPVPFDYQPSFVDGIGGRSVLAEMWPLARRLLTNSIVVTLDEVRDAVRVLLARGRVLAEGAGAAAVAAGRSGAAGSGNVVCVISGGNINLDTVAAFLAPPAAAIRP
ncbi:MAG: pyridoxal-phosphate dependent enzyme [Gemmatimonadetes bacterium]|nr:pyridoxal-phosphate dependent enzyme [Gemmatimonadota bacterium]